MGANGGVEGANRNVEGANGGAPDFSTIIAQQLQNLLPAMLAQVSNRGNDGNQNGNMVNENVQENVESNGREVDCILTRGFERKWSLCMNESCNNDEYTIYVPSHEMKKLETELCNHAMVGAGHAAYTNRFHELARLVPNLVTRESRMVKRYVYGLAPQIRGMVAATEPNTIQKAVQISGALTDEAVRNGSIKKVEKIGNVGEPSKDKNDRNDNKRTRTGNVFATTDCRGVPRNVNPVNARNPTVKAYYECGSTNHVRSACPRMNKAQRPEENLPNQVAANNGGQGRGNEVLGLKGFLMTLKLPLA
ncbi:hypothetical protein Tco_1155703 [Tanacetum coccineum]